MLLTWLLIVDRVLVMEPKVDCMELTVLVRLVSDDEIPLTVVVSDVRPVPMVFTLLPTVVSCVPRAVTWALRPVRPLTLVVKLETALLTEPRLVVIPARLVVIPVRDVVTAARLVEMAVTSVVSVVTAVAVATPPWTVNEPMLDAAKLDVMLVTRAPTK